MYVTTWRVFLDKSPFSTAGVVSFWGRPLVKEKFSGKTWSWEVRRTRINGRYLAGSNESRLAECGVSEAISSNGNKVFYNSFERQPTTWLCKRVFYCMMSQIIVRQVAWRRLHHVNVRKNALELSSKGCKVDFNPSCPLITNFNATYILQKTIVYNCVICEQYSH